MINMKPITDVLTLQCPCCGAPRLQVSPEGLKAVGSRYWLSDGDTIGPLWSKLSDAQKEPNNFDYEMFVGECHSCGESYYVAEASFMAGERELIEPYLHQNVEPISRKYFACTYGGDLEGVPSRWLAQVSETPHGPMHTHTFGPFALESADGVIGQFGVSSCESASGNGAWDHSARILSALWDELRKPFAAVSETTA